MNTVLRSRTTGGLSKPQCFDTFAALLRVTASPCRWLTQGFLLQIIISSHLGNTLIKHIQPSEPLSFPRLLVLCAPIPPHPPTPCFFSLLRPQPGFTARKSSGGQDLDSMGVCVYPHTATTAHPRQAGTRGLSVVRRGTDSPTYLPKPGLRA